MNDDLIRRRDVKTRICVAECAAPECGCVCNLMEAIDGTPAVDAVEVVRCKDCKYRRNSHLGWYCGYEYDRSDPYEMTRRADDENYYCADAERKEKQKDVAAVQVER